MGSPTRASLGGTLGGPLAVHATIVQSYPGVPVLSCMDFGRTDVSLALR